MILKSLLRFVIEQPEELEMEMRFKSLLTRAEFLNQVLTLGMLVPCNRAGKVLEELEPMAYDTQDTSPEAIIYFDDYHKRKQMYLEACESVLFEGYDTRESEYFIKFYINDNCFMTYNKLSQTFLGRTGVKVNVLCEKVHLKKRKL